MKLSPPLIVAMVLAIAAGFIDGFSFLHLQGVFTANMGGNLVFLGLGVGEGDPLSVAKPALTIVALIVGVWLGSIACRSWIRRTSRIPVEATLVIEAALLALVFVLYLELRDADGIVPGRKTFWLLIPAALAMGVQDAVTRVRLGAGFSTVYMSGVIALMGARAAGSPREETRTRERRIADLTTALGLVGFYAGGAALAAAFESGTLSLLIPVGIVSVAIPLALRVEPIVAEA